MNKVVSIIICGTSGDTDWKEVWWMADNMKFEISESDLEQALMDYLQEFMLKEMKEMGI